MSDISTTAISPTQIQPMAFCHGMKRLTVDRDPLFSSMRVVITPVIERQLEPFGDTTEEEEFDQRHKIDKVRRKGAASFSFMKQHF